LSGEIGAEVDEGLYEGENNDVKKERIRREVDDVDARSVEEAPGDRKGRRMDAADEPALKSSWTKEEVLICRSGRDIEEAVPLDECGVRGESKEDDTGSSSPGPLMER